MSGSYNAREEYQKFACEQYRNMRHAFENAIRIAGDKPILVVIGQMDESHIFNRLFNAISAKEDESPAEAASYACLTAFQAAKDIVGQSHTMLSVPLDPHLRGYARHVISSGANIRQEMMPFMCDIAGYMGVQGYRVSYDDMSYRDKTKTPQEKIEDQIEEINRQGQIRGLPVKVMIHCGNSKDIAMFQGQKYQDVLDNGNVLSRGSVEKPPFDNVFGAILYYNVEANSVLDKGCGLSLTNKALCYAWNSFNATPIDLPGALPKDFRIEDAMQAARQASEDYMSLKAETIVSSPSTKP